MGTAGGRHSSVVAQLQRWHVNWACCSATCVCVCTFSAVSAPAAVAGCLQCLGIMAVDLDSEQAPQLLQSLSPELAALVTSPETPLYLSATCLNIMAELTSALASLSGAYQRQVGCKCNSSTAQHISACSRSSPCLCFHYHTADVVSITKSFSCLDECL